MTDAMDAAARAMTAALIEHMRARGEAAEDDSYDSACEDGRKALDGAANAAVSAYLAASLERAPEIVERLRSAAEQPGNAEWQRFQVPILRDAAAVIVAQKGLLDELTQDGGGNIYRHALQFAKRHYDRAEAAEAERDRALKLLDAAPTMVALANDAGYRKAWGYGSSVHDWLKRIDAIMQKEPSDD